MLVGVILLGVLYTICYGTGMVTDFAYTVGADDPGSLRAPDNLRDADLRDLFNGSAQAEAEAERASADPTTLTAAAALDVLESLRVAGRAPQTGYDRGEFGPEWADVDGNGCDTRNDILARDMTEETFQEDTQDCVVLTGILVDPYTATTINFVRGQGTSGAVQIDHVVALSDAWQKGAQALTVEERTVLANDPGNLWAVDGPTNSSKGDGDAATWLPPNTTFRCRYVTAQVTVKAEYDLWVTAAERDAITRVLETC